MKNGYWESTCTPRSSAWVQHLSLVAPSCTSTSTPSRRVKPGIADHCRYLGLGLGRRKPHRAQPDLTDHHSVTHVSFILFLEGSMQAGGNRLYRTESAMFQISNVASDDRSCFTTDSPPPNSVPIVLF